MSKKIRKRKEARIRRLVGQWGAVAGRVEVLEAEGSAEAKRLREHLAGLDSRIAEERAELGGERWQRAGGRRSTPR